jgi:hypothetical protein
MEVWYKDHSSLVWSAVSKILWSQDFKRAAYSDLGGASDSLKPLVELHKEQSQSDEKAA